MFDIRKIPLLINSEKLKGYSSIQKQFISEGSQEYEDFLISVLGEYGYKEEVAKQEKINRKISHKKRPSYYRSF